MRTDCGDTPVRKTVEGSIPFPWKEFLGLVGMFAVIVGVVVYSLAPDRPRSMEEVSQVRGSPCYVDMLATFHEVGTYQGHVVQVYTRREDGWLSWWQCATGAMVHVTETMIKVGRQQEAERAREAAEYATIQERAQQLLREREGR